MKACASELSVIYNRQYINICVHGYSILKLCVKIICSRPCSFTKNIFTVFPTSQNLAFFTAPLFTVPILPGIHGTAIMVTGRTNLWVKPFYRICNCWVLNRVNEFHQWINWVFIIFVFHGLWWYEMYRNGCKMFFSVKIDQ